ncbi:inovirus-type Gp2 protein [Vibrio breoganii]
MYEPSYQGTAYQSLPLNQNHSMNERYLYSAFKTYRHAFECYPKLLMFHATLRFPANYQGNTGGVMSTFTRSLSERIQRDLDKRSSLVDRVHPTNVHYVWCREVSKDLKDHYHIVIMVNANSYRALGCFKQPHKHHLAGMIAHSWASAIGIPISESSGLVHFADEVKIFKTRQLSHYENASVYGNFESSYEEGFYWLSYLCKVTDKRYGDGFRNFGTSQVRSW